MSSIKLVGTYLNGHLGGANAGAALARRLRDQAHSQHAQAWRELAADIEADRRTLHELIDKLGTGQHPIKQAIGQLAERVLRFAGHEKLTRSPELTQVLDCETLALGIEGKHALWVALQEIAPHYPALTEVNLVELAERARDQRDRVDELRRHACTRAFS